MSVPPQLATCPDSGESEPYVSGAYRVVMTRCPAGLQARAAEWDRLSSLAPNRVHTTSYAWVASFFEHLAGPGADCRCLLVFDGGELVGVLPFLVTNKFFSIITKSEVCPPISDQTFASDLVCRCEDAPLIIETMFEALDHFLPGAWELSFHHVSDRSQAVRCLCGGDHHALAHVDFDGVGNFVRTDGTFEGYVGSLRPHFAANLRRLVRKVERLPGCCCDFLTGEDAEPARLDEFLRLEASGWKGRGGTAILADPRERAFYGAFVERLYERRWLEWHTLSVGGHAIAAHLAIRCGRIVYLWKIAYDENYRAYAPGNVLLLRCLERAFELPDVEEVNCLTDSPWNREWNMEHRSYFRVTVWPKRLLPFVAGYCPAVSRSALRRVPGVRPLHRWMRAAASLGRRRPAQLRSPSRD